MCRICSFNYATHVPFRERANNSVRQYFSYSKVGSNLRIESAIKIDLIHTFSFIHLFGTIVRGQCHIEIDQMANDQYAKETRSQTGTTVGFWENGRDSIAMMRTYASIYQKNFCTSKWQCAWRRTHMYNECMNNAVCVHAYSIGKIFTMHLNFLRLYLPTIVSILYKFSTILTVYARPRYVCRSFAVE